MSERACNIIIIPRNQWLHFSIPVKVIKWRPRNKQGSKSHFSDLQYFSSKTVEAKKGARIEKPFFSLTVFFFKMQNIKPQIVYLNS